MADIYGYELKGDIGNVTSRLPSPPYRATPSDLASPPWKDRRLQE